MTCTSPHVNRADEVKLDRLVSHLRREVIANPKKAIVLGLLVLVAAGFWAPLVWGWLASESTSNAKKTATHVSASNASAHAEPVVSDAVDNKKPRPDKHTWKEIGEWIRNDPRMAPASDLPGRQHPFDRVKPPASESMVGDEDHQKKTAAALALVESTLDPESLGLVLSSTIVGSHGRAALINGKSYRLGATIQLNHNQRPIEFQLAEIRGDRVVLQRGERQYEVRLSEPATSGRLEMTLLEDD